jgi:TRAP-type C4-dicarboxylate transport system substrate-binding protein
MKKVENDPYIPQSEKLAKAQELLAKTRNIEKAEIKFMASAKYQNLPTEAEEAVNTDATDSEEEVNLSTDYAVPEDAEEDSDKKETGVDSAEPDVQQEIEDTYNRIERKVQLDDTGETDRKNDAENTVGKTINITV